MLLSFEDKTKIKFILFDYLFDHFYLLITQYLKIIDFKMCFTFHGLLIFAVATQFSICSPLNHEPISESNDDQILIPDSPDVVNTFVEVYTYSHAKCEGMDFQGIIILTKVCTTLSIENVLYY